MGRIPMDGPSFISVNRRGSKSSILLSRSIREGRAELRAATAVIGRRLGNPRLMARQGGSIVQILVTRRGPLSRSRRQGGVHVQILAGDCGVYASRPGGSIVQILATAWLDHLGGHFLSQVALVVRVDFPINGYLIVHQGYLLRRPGTM